MEVVKRTTLFIFFCFLLIGCSIVGKTPREQVVELLDTNGNCQLPCFWGLIPGQTKWENTRFLLSNLTKVYDDDSFYDDGTYPAYSALFTMNDGKPYWQFVIITTVGEDVVQRIFIMAGGTFGETEFLPTYFQRYSIRELFKDIGVPSFVYMNLCPEYSHPCFEMVVIYESQKVALKIFGESLPNDQVCPQIGEGGDITSINLSITNPLSNLDIVPPSEFGPPFAAADYWSPVEEVLGVDETEFYERVLAESPACFNLISD